MRISFSAEKEQTLLWLNRRKEEINRLTDSISSQKRLTAPSDSPSSWAQSVEFKQGLREYDSIIENIKFAVGWNEVVDSTLNSISDLISQARQKGITANGPTGTDGAAALAADLDGIIKEMLLTANAQYGDQYVFAGVDNSSAPYSLDDVTGVVTYSGDDEAVQIRTDRGTKGNFTVNLTGPQVFDFTSGGSTLNVIHEIWELKQAVASKDYDTINAKLGTLDDAFDAIGQNSAVVGSRLSSLETRQTVIGSLKLDTQGRLSDVEDTDLPDAITKLQQETTAYEAALRVTAMLDDLNLASYIS